MQASYRRALQPGPATWHPHLDRNLAAGDLPDAVCQTTSQPSTERVQLGRQGGWRNLTETFPGAEYLTWSRRRPRDVW